MNLSNLESFQRQAMSAGIVFFHSGDFTSPIIAAAAEALKFRIQESGATGPASRKLFSTFVEMAQNIHHYAAPGPEQEEANGPGHGTISVVKGEQEYAVVCVNRIKTSQIPHLTEKLDAIRGMSLDEIKKAYQEQLKHADHGSTNPQSKGAGLGWLTVARDAREPLEYSFSSDPVGGSRYAYFSVKAVI